MDTTIVNYYFIINKVIILLNNRRLLVLKCRIYICFRLIIIILKCHNKLLYYYNYIMINSTLKNTSNDLQRVNSTTLSDIKKLQQIEMELINSLETQNLQKQLSSNELTRYVNKINNISQMRINLYKSLNNLNKFYNSELSNSSYTLEQQTTAIKIVENELNESKKRLEIIKREKNNKIRIVEINNYFGEKYAEQTGLVQSILFFAFLFMILSILLKKNIIPTKLYFVLLIIIVIFAIFNLFNKIYLIMIRDNMNYQAYNWSFKPPVGSYNESTVPSTTDPWANST